MRQVAGQCAEIAIGGDDFGEARHFGGRDGDPAQARARGEKRRDRGFAFLGFDAVSTAAQETKNPKRNMPIGILVSLLVCTVLYMVFAHVMTGVAHYTAFSGQQGIAPVAIAIEHMGQADAAGIIQPELNTPRYGNIAALLIPIYRVCNPPIESPARARLPGPVSAR